MAYSMTGYGTAKANINGIDVEVQVKTLNHRSLDMHVSMGNMPGQLELLFQKMIRQFVGRGRVDVNVIIGEQSARRFEFAVARSPCLDSSGSFQWRLVPK